MQYTYKAIPFSANITEKDNSSVIAGKLQNAINRGADGGWEYIELATCTANIQPGCMGRMTGKAPTPVSTQHLIFRKPDPA